MPSRKPTVLSGEEFKGSQFRLSAIKKTSSGRETAYLNSTDHQGPVLVRSPILRLAFDPSITEYKDGVPKGSLAVALDGYDPDDKANHNPEVEHFYKQLVAVDNVVTEAAIRNSVNMIGKSLAKLAPAVQRKKARAQQTAGVRPSKTNPKTGRPYSPLIKFKFYMTADGTPEVPARLKEENKPRRAIQPEQILQNLKRNCRLRLTFRFSGLWFKSAGRLRQFGFSNIVESIEIFPYSGPKRVVKQPGEFDAAEIVTPDDVRNSYGSPQVRLGYSKPGQRIAIQTPYGVLMGGREGEGIEEFPETVNKKYCRLQFAGHQDGGDEAEFVEALQSIERVIMDLAVERSEAWFGDQIDEDDVRDYLTPIVRRIGDTKGEVDDSLPPFLKVKLPQKGEGEDATFRAAFKDRNGDAIEGLELVEAAARRGTRARAIVMACPLYIMNRATFGLPFEALEVQLDITLAEIHGESVAGSSAGNDHLFAEDEDGDVEEEEEQTASAATGESEEEEEAASPASSPHGVTSVDDDTEDEEEYTQSDEEAVHATAH